MSFTLATLKSTVQDYLQVNETTFNNNLNTFIKEAESRIFKLYFEFWSGAGPTITVWPAPDQNSKYSLYLNVLSRIDDADAGANTLQIPFRFYPCLAAGLAYYIALKRVPEKVSMLKQLYEEEFERALSQDQDRVSFRVAPDLRGYNLG